MTEDEGLGAVVWLVVEDMLSMCEELGLILKRVPQLSNPFNSIMYVFKERHTSSSCVQK